jgi:anthranilate synthase/aminodeoxychorismate synthase-like glutamine amidotransferase
MIAVIDNYDSFTYNLVQYVGSRYEDVRVFRNDAVGISELRTMAPRGIIISPGPGRPEGAGISVQVVKTFGPYLPLLGVCLGHQAIGYAHGANVVQAPVLMHGKTSRVHHDGKGIYTGLPTPFEATRYHSLVLERESIPATFEITAQTEDGVVMGIRHREYPLEGVQFHPESILTQHGMTLIETFLSLTGVKTHG